MSHLYAKLNGAWVEPQSVCVTMRRNDAQVSGVKRPGLFIVVRTVPETYPHSDLSGAGIPEGTRMSLGLSLPPGSNPKYTRFQARDVVAAFNDTSFALQGTTFSAIRTLEFGYQRPNCAGETKRFNSMFYGNVALQPLNADGSPNELFDGYAGSFFGTNAEYALPPLPRVDANGNRGIVIPIANCGDGDATNKEGFYQGYLNLPAFEHVGLSQSDLAAGSAFIDELLQMRDSLAGSGIDADFTVIEPGALAFEPIDGVTFPAFPAGPGPTGVQAGGIFGYSSLDVVTESIENKVGAFHKCRDKGGRPTVSNGALSCIPDRTKPKTAMKVAAKLTLKDLAGDGVTVSCNEPCKASVELLLDKSDLQSARKKARKLVVAGQGRGKTKEAGSFRVRVKVKSSLRKQLKGLAYPVNAVLRASVTDRAGNSRTLKRKVTLTG